jgi:membrane associated rhomboid family serine protease
VVLIIWFVWQVLGGLDQLSQLRGDISGGVAVWAHVGGFVAGMLLVRVFVDRDLVQRRVAMGDAKWAFEHDTAAP